MRVSASCPELPRNTAEALYCVMEAYWATRGYKSAEASVKVVPVQ